MRDPSSKLAAIQELSKQIQDREGEVLRLKAAVSQISKLENQIHMLRGSLALIQDGNGMAEITNQTQPSNGAESIWEVAQQILKKAGRPLGAGEIVAIGSAHGKTINYHSLTSTMAAKIRERKQFYRQGSGKNGRYALLEWIKREAQSTAE